MKRGGGEKGSPPHIEVRVESDELDYCHRVPFRDTETQVWQTCPPKPPKDMKHSCGISNSASARLSFTRPSASTESWFCSTGRSAVTFSAGRRPRGGEQRSSIGLPPISAKPFPI